MGNVLHGDDGFGAAVVEVLEGRELRPAIEVTEVGISGVSTAQDLMDGCQAMVLVDAMERGEEPGTVYVERAEVPDIEEYSRRETGSFAAGMHQTDPSKVLVLGEALDMLPDPTVFVSCGPRETDELEDALSDSVRTAVPRAADHIETVAELEGALWDAPENGDPESELLDQEPPIRPGRAKGGPAAE